MVRGLVSAPSLSFDQASVAQQVASALRDLLLKGEIPPGAKLREVQLAQALSVSRHTLRAGFRILEAEGLLEHSLNHGVVVPELSPDRIADVFRARKAMEFAGVHALHHDDGRSDTIEGMSHAIKAMKSSRNEAELAAADLDFHTAVVAAVGSSLIDELYRNVQAQLRLTRAWAQRSRGNRNLMAQTHQEVVEHLRNASVDLASNSLMAINDLGEARLLKAMRALKGSTANDPRVWPPPNPED